MKNKNKLDLENLIHEFYPFAKKRLGFTEDITSYNFQEDLQNAANPLGKTAYYEPESKTITVYITDRHPKDILRSFSHELVHHKQNCDGKLNGLETSEGYAQQEGVGREAEKEAYLEGNLIFRDWEDSQKRDIKEMLTPKTLAETRRKKLNNKLYEAYGYQKRYSEDASIELSKHTIDIIRQYASTGAAAELVRTAETGNPIPMELAHEAVYELTELLDANKADQVEQEDVKITTELYWTVETIKKALQKQGYM